MADKHEFRLEGLTCANCARQFEKNVQQIATVEGAEVNFGASKITVIGDVTVEEIDKAGAFDGIKVQRKKTEQRQKQSFFYDQQTLTTLFSLVFLLFGIMLHITLGSTHPLVVSIFILAIIVGGYELFIAGVKNLFRFYFDMKTLMTMAVIGAVLIGEWLEAAIVVLLFAISETLESYSIDKARKSIQTLMEIAPTKAVVRRKKELIELDVEDVVIDDVLVVKPGEKIAMDGEIIRGTTSVNQAAITGESLPVTKSLGDEVFAGTMNEQGAIEVRVTRLKEDTTLAKIIHLVEEAQTQKAPAQYFIDRFATYYTPAIMFLALFVATVPPLLFAADWSKWIYLGLATLVVGCPCALIISTPVAIVTAIGNAARNGVLIKGGAYLEQLGRLTTIAFDKTGTLTKGSPEVTNIIATSTISHEVLLKIAATIEQYSEHPIASSIVEEAKKQNITTDEGDNFQSFTGKGAKATVNGREFYIGNVFLFQEINEQLALPHEQIETLQKEGKTVVLLGTKTEIVAIFAISDQPRKSAKRVIQKLHGLGIKLVMLTGDNEHTARAVASKLAIDEVKANLLPEEKLAIINKLKQEKRHVAMVGDGVNDAPALASAEVGIAMGGAGTDVALETADITLMEDDLTKLPYTISLSQRTLRVIKQNISFSLILKVIALLLVIPGWLTLWIAIIADVGATLLVVLNAMRLMRSDTKVLS